MYIPCKNDSTLSTDVSVGSSFFDNACCFHFLRIASYFDFVVSLHDSDNFCNLLWNFSASDCFPDNGTASSLIFGNSGCIACLFDDKINNFLLLGSWSGKSRSICSIKGNQNWVCKHNIIMIPLLGGLIFLPVLHQIFYKCSLYWMYTGCTNVLALGSGNQEI